MKKINIGNNNKMKETNISGRDITMNNEDKKQSRLKFILVNIALPIIVTILGGFILWCITNKIG